MTNVIVPDYYAPDDIRYNAKPVKRTKFWCMMAGFMALIFIRNVIAIEYPIVILLAYACGMAMLCDHDEIIALAVSFIPFFAAFQYRYALLVLLVIYALKYFDNLKKINLNVYIPLLLMMCWELLHGIVGEFSFVSFLQGFSELIFCTFVISLPNKKFDFRFIARVLAICVVFSCSVLLIKLLQTTNFDFNEVFLSGNYRFGVSDKEETSYVMNYNANELGYICNLSIIGLILRVRKVGINITDACLIGSLVFFGSLTLSRSFVLCLALIVVMFIFAFAKNIGNVVKGVAAVSVIIFVLLFVLNLTVPFVLENIVSRFNEDDVTGGRSSLMELYGDFIFLSPMILFLGIGVQNIEEKASAINPNIFGVPHNGVQELMIAWGLVGFVLFCYFLMLIVSESRKRVKRQKFANYIPIIMILIVAQAGQLITSGSKLMLLYFAYVVLCTDFSVATNKNERRIL